MTRCYVLVATGVYDQGVVGVYSTEELARGAAATIWPKTDGHHSFTIVPSDLDRTYEGAFPYWHHGMKVPPTDYATGRLMDTPIAVVRDR